MEGRNKERCQRAPSSTLSLAVIQALVGKVSCPKEVIISGRATQLGRDICQGSRLHEATPQSGGKGRTDPPPPAQGLALLPAAFLKQLIDDQDMLLRAWHGGKRVRQCSAGSSWRHTQNERATLLRITFFFTQDEVTETPVFKSPKERIITHDRSAVLCKRSGTSQCSSLGALPSLH